MIPRRFINLMMKDLRGVGSYWLSRMTPEKNLFYASVGEAVASKARMQLCADTSDLSSAEFRFRSSRSLDSKLAFMPFYGVAGGPSEGRIVVSDSAGHTHLYDAEEVSSEMLPPTKESSDWHSPISVCIANDAVRADALYAINGSTSTNFKSLAYRKGDIMDPKSASGYYWDWLDLPPPPYISGKGDPTIKSYTLLEDNKTICFSSGAEGGFGTYCFDTTSQEWTKAGSWTLPFLGRALCLPQLYNLYFGFHDSSDESLVALELPSPLDGDAPPKVLHEWRGFSQPDQRAEWSLMASNLLYLGNHKFCTARFFSRSVELNKDIVDMTCVLTGVEIVDGQADKAKLQMVKHKTIIYIFHECSIEAVF